MLGMHVVERLRQDPRPHRAEVAVAERARRLHLPTRQRQDAGTHDLAQNWLRVSPGCVGEEEMKFFAVSEGADPRQALRGPPAVIGAKACSQLMVIRSAQPEALELSSARRSRSPGETRNQLKTWCCAAARWTEWRTTSADGSTQPELRRTRFWSHTSIWTDRRATLGY
jgi:hypothetical protein